MEELKVLGKIYGKMLLSLLVPAAVMFFGITVIGPNTGWFALVLLAFVSTLGYGVYSIISGFGELHLHSMEYQKKGQPRFMEYRRELWRLERKRKRARAAVIMNKGYHYSYTESLNDLRSLEAKIASHKGLTDE